MNAEKLLKIGGIALSLACFYAPGLKVWFEGLSAVQKAAFQALILFLCAGGYFALSCAGIVKEGAAACTLDGGFDFVMVYIDALVANQASYLLNKPLASLLSALKSEKRPEAAPAE